MIRIRTCLTTFVSAFAVAVLIPDASPAGERWSREKAESWARETPWLVGCNYIPSTAINQLEMWQADTFDPRTIDRELGWAEGLGFDSVRVFLHDIPWKDDREGFLKRIERFLEIADSHHLGAMFVLLDSCWDPSPAPGKQRPPRPHVHNSGWVQSPGLAILKDPARHGELEGYIKGMIGHFRADRRVQVWDLFNEPDNTNTSSYGRQEPTNKPAMALALLGKAYTWAREADPTQPVTSGVWVGDWEPGKLSPTSRLQLEESDIITFHNYTSLPELEARIATLRKYGRPLVCTEYMARPAGSRFDPALRVLREQRIGAYNWGFVSGKSQTIYPWDSWKKTYTAEPEVWFHDIFRNDGTPYDPNEVAFIRQVTGKAKP